MLMKRTVLFLGLLYFSFSGYAQNINDNKVSIAYTQLPLIKIDEAFKKYEVRVEHAYQSANEDSLMLFQARQDAAMQQFERLRIQYQQMRDSLDRQHLRQLSQWEKQTNAGAVGANGQPLPKPNPPMYPEAPIYPNVPQPQLHTAYDETNVQSAMQIQGFEQGLGGCILTITIQPIRDIRILEKRKGSGSSTKYQYTCEYVMPLTVKLESPTQGTLLQTNLFEQKKSYRMQEQKSRYDHQLFMLDQADQFYTDLERYARQQAMKDANNYINDQVGYVRRNRNTEIYSVKKFKSYDYSDVTNAYSATIEALNLVQNDRDCSSAQDKLNSAMAMWKEIMMESNTYDNKARINDKISAMIQCNIAEIQLWQAKFNEANATLNLVLNSGVLKGKNHAKRAQSFYNKRSQRWKVNY